MTYVCILGRQPALGLAELESRFGAAAIKPIQPGIVLLETKQLIALDFFGGLVKVVSLKDTFHGTDWKKIASHIESSINSYYFTPEQTGKITLGVSTYGIQATPQQINATALSLKKKIKTTGRSVRVVPNKEKSLNTAQVIHNKLARGRNSNGIELVFIKDGYKTIIATTFWVQDIDAYRQRDQERPMRDARVGMLPPKLAQIITNLAVAQKTTSLNYDEIEKSPTVLDPFCGTGVILQEATIQNYRTYGTDLDKRMVEYSQKNLEWFGAQKSVTINQADATSYTWQNFDTIACETYLGRPFSSPPDQETLQKVVHDVNIIHKKFLQNVARQTKPGFRMCIAVPAWYIKGNFKHLPVLDHLEELGYNRISFVHAKTEDLIYHRVNQVVARELVVLTRK
jgi:tRNA G10  N-methylase Trm11